VSKCTTGSSERIELVLRPKHVVISADKKYVKGSNLTKIYADMAGTTNFEGTIFDAIFTDKHVFIKPVCKTPFYATAMAAITLPMFAETVDLLSKRVTSFLNDPAESLVGKPVEIEILQKLPLWSLSSLVEVKQSLPTLWKTASTVMTFSNALNVSESNKHCNLNLVFDGSASHSKKQFLEFPNLAKLCNFNPSKVQNY
jgi:hypothetical protein